MTSFVLRGNLHNQRHRAYNRPRLRRAWLRSLIRHIVADRCGAGGRNRTDTSVRKPDFASHYGFRHDAFALQHRRFDGLDFIFTMGFRR